ncbi:MAG: putative phosphoesterase [Parasphingorhabdus sp.]|jgi:putative phosphoesterase
MNQKIGILSDTHGVLDADVFATLRGCEKIVHAGDIGCGEVLAQLGWYEGRVIAITGNNDFPGSWRGEFADILTGLSDCVKLNLPGGILVVEHGHSIWDTRHYHERLRLKHPSAKLIVYGHTHIRRVDRGLNPWVVNPGAAGRERTKQGPSCLILEISTTGQNEHHWDIQEYCFEKKPYKLSA